MIDVVNIIKTSDRICRRDIVSIYIFRRLVCNMKNYVSGQIRGDHNV